ncbi:MAG TPA: cyanophycin synthetase [Caldilineaceae bacterium]|nr:cyanophycin synthetase [Caldilineaceae bacterium]
MGAADISAMEGQEPNFPYYNTVDQIYHADWSIAKLARLELLRESIRTLWPNGHPTRLIHVAGTSGKGSTCRFLEVGLSAVGKSGAFMSPHLFDYRERFSIGGEFVSQDDVNEVWQRRIQPHCVRLALHNPHHAHTFHEVSILVALALFERHEVAWAAMETSVGGRYDQTRALDVAATVLTNVGSDHSNLLGRAHWQRVLDKAGIARPGVPFFTGETDAESRTIIAAVCREVGAPLTLVDGREVCRLEEALACKGLAPMLDDALLDAGYQKWNAALSLAVIRSFYPALDEGEVLARMAAARLPGRFWRVEEGVYADIAHNTEKMRALVSEVESKFAGKGKILIIGMSGHRAPKEVFALLAHIARAIIVTGASYKGQDPESVRANIESLAGDVPTLVIADPRQALEVAKSMRTEQDIVLLTGSTYMIEQALNPDPYLRYLSATYGWRTRQEMEATGTVQLTLPKSPPVR